MIRGMTQLLLDRMAIGNRINELNERNVMGMTVMEAEAVTLDFGKHSGKSLGEIVDGDLLYLDWLVGRAWVRAKKPRVFEALEAITVDRADEIDRLLE